MFEKQAGEHQVVVNSTSKNLLSGRFGRISSIIGRLWSNHNSETSPSHHASKYRIFALQSGVLLQYRRLLLVSANSQACLSVARHILSSPRSDRNRFEEQTMLNRSIGALHSIYVTCIQYFQEMKRTFSYPDSSASLPR